MPSCLLDESLLRALLETSEDAILEMSLDGKIVRWNRAAEKLYGYSEAEMREQSLPQLVPIHEAPLVKVLLQDLQRGEIPRSETLQRIQKDGTCISVTARRAAIRDEQGRVTGMVESARALKPEENGSPAEKQLRLSNLRSGIRLSQSGSGKFMGRRVPEFLQMPLRSFDGEIIGCMGVALDITERKKSEEQMLHQAKHDALTGLANYREFVETLERELKRAGRSRNSFAVLLLDLDGLKQINDRSGHLAGNRALKRLAIAMREHCRSSDLPARYGGDEFALVLIDADPAMAEQVAERIRRNLGNESGEAPLGVSIGIASYPADGRTGQELLEAADQRLYVQKKETRKKSLTAR